MRGVPWVISAILILGILFVVLIILLALNRKKKAGPDYYTFFIMGATWLIVGVILQNYGLITLGMIFVIIGLINKNKWKENRKSWNELTKKDKTLQIVVMIVLGILILLGILFLILVKRGVV